MAFSKSKADFPLVLDDSIAIMLLIWSFTVFVMGMMQILKRLL